MQSQLQLPAWSAVTRIKAGAGLCPAQIPNLAACKYCLRPAVAHYSVESSPGPQPAFTPTMAAPPPRTDRHFQGHYFLPLLSTRAIALGDAPKHPGPPPSSKLLILIKGLPATYHSLNHGCRGDSVWGLILVDIAA